MKKGIAIILLLLAVESYSQVKDTLFFFNQAILIGELQKVKLGRIEFDGDGVGDVRIKYDKIKTMKASMHSYRIETTDKKLLYGIIESSDKPGSIIVHSANGNSEIRLATITSLSFYGKNMGTRLSGEVGAGFSYTKSSDIGRLNINEKLKYINRKLEMQLDGNMIITTDSNSTYRERENLQFSCNYLINNSWYAGTLLSYQRNKELGLLSRWQQGAGIGYKFLQRQHSIGKSITGIVVNEEHSINDNHNTLLEWVLQGDYNFFSFSKPDITLSATQTVFFSLSQKGRIRYDGDIRINWEFIKDFSFSLSFYHNYDRKSPATQSAKVDYGFVAGLNYEF
jgi:hypothetical protein